MRSTVVYLHILLASVTLTLSPAIYANDLEGKIALCAGISDPSERLACFDGLAAGKALPAAPASVAGPTKPAEQPTPTPTVADDGTEALGEKYLERSKREKKEKKTNYDVVVAKVDKDTRGRLRYYLESGQIWRQTEVRNVSRPRSLPTPATISVGFLGSHAIRIQGVKSSVKVKRVK
ncbi:MAG: hypothetical protein AAF438_01035 [Pseudomonadota bacterium]